MSDMQEENNEEASKEKRKRSVATQTPCLEGEVGRTGWEVSLVQQDENSLVFKVYCRDEARDWYQLLVRCPKSKFRKIGV
jgi:hypothetical protein